MVECYKKYVLISLLHYGQVIRIFGRFFPRSCFSHHAAKQVQQVPKYTSSIVQRHLKGTCPQYQEFANAYSTNSTDEVHKVAGEHHDAFQKVRCSFFVYIVC